MDLPGLVKQHKHLARIGHRILMRHFEHIPVLFIFFYSAGNQIFCRFNRPHDQSLIGANPCQQLIIRRILVLIRVLVLQIAQLIITDHLYDRLLFRPDRKHIAVPKRFSVHQKAHRVAVFQLHLFFFHHAHRQLRRRALALHLHRQTPLADHILNRSFALHKDLKPIRRKNLAIVLRKFLIRTHGSRTFCPTAS